MEKDTNFWKGLSFVLIALILIFSPLISEKVKK